MRFFDREAEFEKLREIEELSQEVAQFTSKLPILGYPLLDGRQQAPV